MERDIVDQTRDAAPRWWLSLLRLAENLLDLLFRPVEGGLASVISVLWLAGLFGFGIYLWGIFFSWGNISFDFLDWAEVTGPRYAVLQDAARQGQLPLHVTDTTALRGVTDRFLAIADTPFSPQFLLLRWMEMGQFIFYDTLLFYGLGFLGLFFIFRKYRLSLFSFTVLFFLFNFNGHITAHLAVGHANWVGYFLLPFFALSVFHLIETRRGSWRWVLGLSLTLLVILLQGHFHLYLWCLMFLALLALLNWRLIKPMALAGLSTLLVSLPRLLPPTLALEGVQQDYLGGFASITHLLSSLITLNDPDRAIHPASILFMPNAWELDFFIGFLGAVIVFYFGVYLALKRNPSRSSLAVQILVPSLILAVFSIGEIFSDVIRVFTFPPLTGERVTSRILSLPLVLVMTLGVIVLQRELNRRHWLPLVQLVSLGLVYVLYQDLNQHLRAWRVRYLDGLVNLFPKMPFDPSRHTIAIHPDPVYTTMLLGGLAVALLTLLGLIALTLRESRLRSAR